MRQVDSRTIGITATVPVEVILAAGAAPLDLNNAFIGSADAPERVTEAERRGFPLNGCAWIKGLYATVRRLGVRRVIGVAQGDCSNTHALMEVLESEGVEVIAFNYPYPPRAADLGRAIEGLCRRLGTTRRAAEDVRRDLVPVREALAEIDRLTWQEGRVSGEQNHRWLVGASDFEGDPSAYLSRARAFIAAASGRAPEAVAATRHRLGLLGIPPIRSDLHACLDRLGGAVVFNEFQRQFSMPAAVAAPPARDLVEQYLAYTYPYGVGGRIADVRSAARERRLDGLVHYVQSFCFRQIQDRLLRESLAVPMLTLEFDRPGPVDGPGRTRMEAFIEMLDGRKEAVGGPDSKGGALRG